MSYSNKPNPYWESTEAKKVFIPLDEELEALDAIKKRMELLSNVINDSKVLVFGVWVGEG
jgi:hypothetical protein